LLWSFVDGIFPPRCAGCNRHGVIWCDECKENSVRRSKVCPSCNRNSYGGSLCVKCENSPPFFERIYAHGLYLGRLQKAIHNLKYNRQISFGAKIGEEIGYQIKGNNWNFDIVLPIPLSKQRYKKRGYNQVQLMAEAIGFVNGVFYSNSILIRRKDTSSQVGLTLKERENNIKGAFFVKSNQIVGKNILIVDDVFTTGSTLNEAAYTLKSAGANKIFGSVCATVP
jgi:ComF family protein